MGGDWGLSTRGQAGWGMVKRRTPVGELVNKGVLITGILAEPYAKWAEVSSDSGG
jgi:hypothetical protein